MKFIKNSRENAIMFYNEENVEGKRQIEEIKIWLVQREVRKNGGLI